MPTNMIQKLGSLLNQPGGIPQLTEANGISIFAKNANAIILGSPTKEGGNIIVFRNDSGNIQLSVDADAASNAKALDVYGGVVCQNYLTVGQDTLNTTYPFYDNGIGYIKYLDSDKITLTHTAGIETYNNSQFPLNVPVAGSDSSNHSIDLKIDNNKIIVAQATGDGAGGITNPAIGLYPGTTPTTQAAAISDPAESIAGNNAAIDSILAALRAIGLIAT